MIDKKTYFLTPLLPLGLILILFGLFVIVRDFLFLQKVGLVYFNVTGLIIVLVGFAIFLFKGGFKFDPINKTLTKYIRFAGLKLWTNQVRLPKSIDYIEVVKKNKTLTSYYKAAIPITSKVITYDVYIVYEKGYRFSRLFSIDSNQALEYGQVIADAYNVELVKKI
jgi:hypothetical protein